MLWTGPRRVDSLSSVSCFLARRVTRQRLSSVIPAPSPDEIQVTNPQFLQALGHLFHRIGRRGHHSSSCDATDVYADAALPRSEPPHELVTAIRTCGRGRTFLAEWLRRESDSAGR